MSYPLLFLTIKWLHILTASLWTGGIIFTVMVNRGLRKNMAQIEATRILGTIGRVIQKPMRVSLYISILTGILLLLVKGINPIEILNPSFYLTSLGNALLRKAISVALILLMIPFHSRLGNRIYGESNIDIYSRIRRRLLLVGWATLVFSLTAMLFGTELRLT